MKDPGIASAPPDHPHGSMPTESPAFSGVVFSPSWSRGDSTGPFLMTAGRAKVRATGEGSAGGSASRESRGFVAAEDGRDLPLELATGDAVHPAPRALEST